MKKIILSLLFVLPFLCGMAQSGEKTTNVTLIDSATTKPDSGMVVAFAEKMPEFPGGQTAFGEFLQKNIHYPAAERKANKQGVVYVEFVVEKDGSITNVQVVKGVPDAPGLSAEAVRVISMMPKWSTGVMNGQPVRVRMTQPIKFML